MKRTLFILLLVLVPLGVYGFWPIEAPTTATVERRITIDAPLWQAYMRLAPPNTVQKIVVLGNSQYIGEESEEEPQKGPLGFGLAEQLRMGLQLSLNRDVERHSVLTVETNDDYVGKQTIQLKQDAVITLNGITSHTKLLEAQGRLLDYDCTSSIQGNDSQTIIDAKLVMTIQTRAPRLFRWIPKRRVRAAAELRLELLEEAFREVIDKPLLPGESPPEGVEASLLRRHQPLADWRRRSFTA